MSRPQIQADLGSLRFDLYLVVQLLLGDQIQSQEPKLHDTGHEHPVENKNHHSPSRNSEIGTLFVDLDRSTPQRHRY